MLEKITRTYTTTLTNTMTLTRANTMTKTNTIFLWVDGHQRVWDKIVRIVPPLIALVQKDTATSA